MNFYLTAYLMLSESSCCASRGRNDLQDFVSLGANAIRSYEYKGYYNHTPFLNYAHSLGLKVLQHPH